MAIPSTRTSHISVQRLLKLLMMRELVTLNGATTSDNFVNSRRNSVTASCQTSTLPTQSLGSGLRISAADTNCTMKETNSLLTAERVQKLEFVWEINASCWSQRSSVEKGLCLDYRNLVPLLELKGVNRTNRLAPFFTSKSPIGILGPSIRISTVLKPIHLQFARLR
jgi:hypothetical protein